MRPRFWTGYLRTRQEFIYDIMCRVENPQKLADKRDRWLARWTLRLTVAQESAGAVCRISAGLAPRSTRLAQHLEDGLPCTGRLNPAPNWTRFSPSRSVVIDLRAQNVAEFGAMPGRPPGHITSRSNQFAVSPIRVAKSVVQPGGPFVVYPDAECQPLMA